jgi:hypothetical protein
MTVRAEPSDENGMRSNNYLEEHMPPMNCADGAGAVLSTSSASFSATKCAQCIQDDREVDDLLEECTRDRGQVAEGRDGHRCEA